MPSFPEKIYKYEKNNPNKPKDYLEDNGSFKLKYLADFEIGQYQRKYRIIDFLGQGGNGIVYLVLCVSNCEYEGQFFALKLFLHSDERRKEQFQQECNFLKGINHPSIIQYFDEGFIYDKPCVVTSYIPNTLKNEIQNLDFFSSLFYSLQILSGLKYLHSQGYIHRDLKPQNIFIDSRRAIIGDLGLIYKFPSNNDERCNEDLRQSDIIGLTRGPKEYRTHDSQRYISDGTPLTVKADIQQIGFVIAEMFGGKNPQKPPKYEEFWDAQELYLSPIIIDNDRNRYGFIKTQWAPKIVEILDSMINEDPEQRPNLQDVIKVLKDTLTQYTKHKLLLDNKIF